MLIYTIFLILSFYKKIFNDTLDSSNNDCEVTEIGGKPALQVIIDFANNNISQSKDLGVRFNMALAPSTGLFSQKFTLRNDLPETSSITYKLTCPKKKSFRLVREWNITYDDGFGLFNNFCLEQNAISSDKRSKITSSDEVTELISSSDDKKQKFAHAKLVYDGSATCYVLDNNVSKDNKVGIVVFTAEKKTLEFSIIECLQKLAKLRVKKVRIKLLN